MRDYFGSETLKVVVILLLGLFVIMYFNPPHTACTAELAQYQTSFGSLIGTFNSNRKLCTERPDPGGCFPFLESVSKIEQKVREVGSQCLQELKKDANTGKFFDLAMEMIVKLAWGSQPPQNYLYRNGWLESSHIVLFCKLKKHQEAIFGEDSWNSLVETSLETLPGAAEVGRNEAWGRSILSDPCKYSL
ncbi:MAG: hypothetical protein IT289_03950 [Oligoflexia bacterium]|nr:hypothetical protein [Oligoflexia bacterium]